jgi:hypothetical protein
LSTLTPDSPSPQKSKKSSKVRDEVEEVEVEGKGKGKEKEKVSEEDTKEFIGTYLSFSFSYSHLSILLPLECLQQKWKSAIYSFYHPTVWMGEETNRQKFLILTCWKSHCTKTVKWYLDGRDKSSTSNLKKHSESCFGETVVKEALAGDLPDANTKGRDRDIASAFKQSGKVSYSIHVHTKEELQYVPSCII